MSDKNYTKLLFLPNNALQARELGDMQDNAAEALRSVADVLFADGDIGGGAACAVDELGQCTLDEGRIYLAGRVRSVGAANFNVATVGEVSVGIYLLNETVTPLQDPDLYDQEKSSPAHGEAGANRTRTTCSWGQVGDGQQGDFYPVWTIVDGAVRPREAAPQTTAMTKAIEGYDVESTGGNYVAYGMEATMLDNDAEGRQVYSISAGAARVRGVAVRSGAARRLVFGAVADVQAVQSEPHSSATVAAQRIKFDRSPVLLPATVRVQRRKTVTLTRGPIGGGADVLPENSVVKINSVKQGATTYVQATDYKLTASQVDWSLPGAEVAPGNQFDVDFEYMSTEAVQDQTPHDFAITGAVKDTVMFLDYQFALRRIDVIVIDGRGDLNVVKGVPAVWNPVAPDVPRGLLGLASIWQSWDTSRAVIVNQVRTVPMDELVGYQKQINSLKTDQAELRLAVDVSGRYGGLRKGYFADPMLDNTMRDQGMEQTALIAGGALQLDEPLQALPVDDGNTSHSMKSTAAVYLSQAFKTLSMTVAPPPPPVPPPPAPPLPATAALTPSIDRWISEGPALTYPGSSRSIVLLDGLATFESARNELGQALDASKIDTSKLYMREIEVRFKLEHFKPSELLLQMSFDGQIVNAQPLPGATLIANASGVIEGRFTVPPKLPTGVKALAFAGNQGSTATTQYTGQVQIKVNLNVVYTSGSYASVGTKVVTYVV